MKKIFYFPFILLLFFGFVPVFAQPANLSPTGGGPMDIAPSEDGITLENPLGGIKTLPDLLIKILEMVVTLGVPIVTIAIIWSGFLYVTAQGNQTKIGKAHLAIYGTIIGASIVLGAFVIAEIIKSTVEQLNTGASVENTLSAEKILAFNNLTNQN